MKFDLDKHAHFYAGMAVMLAASLVFGWLFGLLAGISIGILKEIKDYFGDNTPDYKDAIATALGSVAGAVWYGLHNLVA